MVSTRKIKGSLITVNLIIEKAKIFYQLFQQDAEVNTIFNPTNGFLKTFKLSHGIQQFSIHGEILLAKSENINSFLEELNQIIHDQGFSPEQIYNCDEKELNWKALPNRTLASLNE